MANNLIGQIDGNQFVQKELSSRPAVGSIIDPANPKYAIMCMPTRNNKYYHLMTKINDSGKAVTQISTNTPGFTCFLKRPPRLGEVIYIESVGEKSAVGKLGTMVGDKFSATKEAKNSN